MAPCKRKPTYFYLTSSSCANVLQCRKVKVACKFKWHTAKKFRLAKKIPTWCASFFFGGYLRRGGGGTKKNSRELFFHPAPGWCCRFHGHRHCHGCGRCSGVWTMFVVVFVAAVVFAVLVVVVVGDRHFACVIIGMVVVVAVDVGVVSVLVVVLVVVLDVVGGAAAVVDVVEFVVGLVRWVVSWSFVLLLLFLRSWSSSSRCWLLPSWFFCLPALLSWLFWVLMMFVLVPLWPSLL